MDANRREARWLTSYDNQKRIWETKQERKAKNLMDQMSLIEQKMKKLADQKAEIEMQLKKVADETFISFDSFRQEAIRRSEESKTSNIPSTEEKEVHDK